MGRYLELLTSMVIVVVMALADSAMAGEPTLEEIPKLIHELASRDAELADAAAERLKSVRSGEAVSAILGSMGTASRQVHGKLCRILGAIGEPAVEIVFAGCVPEAGSTRARVSYAGQVLTGYLHTAALPHLAVKVREGELEVLSNVVYGGFMIRRRVS